eukprot:jgi/Undpi1/1666/HiC_scaffold_11.g05056.m1
MIAAMGKTTEPVPMAATMMTTATTNVQVKGVSTPSAIAVLASMSTSTKAMSAAAAATTTMTRATSAEPKAVGLSGPSALSLFAAFAAIFEPLPLEGTTTTTTTATPVIPKPDDPRSPAVPAAPAASAAAPTAAVTSTPTTSTAVAVPTRFLFSDENQTPQHSRGGKPSTGATVGRRPWVGAGVGGAVVSSPRRSLASIGSPLTPVPISTTPRVALADKTRAQKSAPRGIVSVVDSPVKGGNKKTGISSRGGGGGGSGGSGGGSLSRVSVSQHSDGARAPIEAVSRREKEARRSSAPRPTASRKAAARPWAAVTTANGVLHQRASTRSQLVNSEKADSMTKRLRSAGRAKKDGLIAAAGGQKALAGAAVSSRTRQAKATNKATPAAGRGGRRGARHEQCGSGGFGERGCW